MQGPGKAAVVKECHCLIAAAAVVMHSIGEVRPAARAHHGLLDAERQPQIADPHVVDHINGLQSDYIEMAGGLTHSVELLLRASLQRRV